jgi:hypothetical protein
MSVDFTLDRDSLWGEPIKLFELITILGEEFPCLFSCLLYVGIYSGILSS